MHSLWNFIVAHQTTATLVAYYIGSAIVSSLPAPTATSGQFYKFIFAFSNTIAANISRAKSTRVENSPNFGAAVAIQTGQVTTSKTP